MLFESVRDVLCVVSFALDSTLDSLWRTIMTFAEFPAIL